MVSISDSDQRHLDAAQGWLGLGNWKEANEELDLISPQTRAHPEVLSVRWRVYSLANKWEPALEIARAMSETVPAASIGFMCQAESLSRLNRTAEAIAVLLPVVDRFADHVMLRYTLACYYCQLGELEKAFAWLSKAIDLDEKGELRGIALDDPDLEPLWTSIGEI